MSRRELEALAVSRVQRTAAVDRVWMFGPAWSARGGMASVAQSYADGGLFDQCGVKYVSTYEGANPILQLRVFGGVLLQLLGALLLRRVDLVHLHSASRGSFIRKSLIAALCRAFGVPYLFHLHSGEFLRDYLEAWPHWKRMWAQRTMNGATCVIVLSPSWQASFEPHFPAARYEVVLNPVEVPEELPQKSERRHEILFLGRITDKKGAFDLLAALPAVLAHWPQIHVTMAGPGEIDRARQLVGQLGLPDGVVDFPGWIDGPRKLQALASAGTFVLPSHFEGVPIGVLEAMAEGMAVVATRVGGIPDVIDSGRNGRLVAIGDVQALTDALIQVHSEPSVTETQVIDAFATVQAHRLSVVVESLAAMYARSISERR